ncbi:transforming growth factor beta like domain protein [Teladorsagia circumcincta]|uniref:Transforming growth factor beta like domain protein n=1 Tax=Teladorsagia circumcincta TaxID=45464 RepID=A0A2G9TZE8_TELCI|nr:transforming growth factor beta like domain protein [Teladorsagia circumcincta]
MARIGDDPPADEEKKEKNDEKSNDVRMCQKRGSVVDLKQLGWGRWVIAPAEFEAGFCSGICPNPLPKDMHPSNHALLQTLLKSASVPPVCCSPSQARSLTIFYRDELGRSTIRNFENMIIESCACQ